MSNTDQHSFYEIQLNTHHLLMAFIGAVGVGVAVFYLGVLVGHDQGPEAVAADDWRQATAGATEGEGEPLDFYDTVREPTGAASREAQTGEAVAQSATTETAAGGEAGRTPAPTADAAAPVSEARPAPADAGRQPGAAPADARSQPAASGTAADIPLNDPSLASGWVVQVRSVPQRPVADSLQEALYEAGFPAFVVTADVRGVAYYRVRVGRYRTESEAQLVAEALSRRPDVDQTWVTEG